MYPSHPGSHGEEVGAVRQSITYPPQSLDTYIHKRCWCPFGVHLFQEVAATPNDARFTDFNAYGGGSAHMLHCDACGLEVHISRIVQRTQEETASHRTEEPEGADTVVGG